MPYQITYTDAFSKHYKRLSQVEQKQVTKKIAILLENPSHPSLRTKYIKGHTGILECSANMDIRIIWKYSSDTLIVALDIGHHDILKKF